MLRHSPHLTASLLVPSFSNYLSNLDMVEPTFQRFLSFTAELSERDCWVYLSCPKEQQSAVIDAFSEFTVFLAFSSHAQKPSFQFHNTCVYVLAPRTVFLENRDRILELATHRAKLEEATCPTPALTSEFSIVDWNILGVCFALRYASEEGASPFSRDRHRHVLTLNKLVDVLHPDFACMQEVDKFSQFWRAQLVLSGYKFLYARNAPRKDGLCIIYNDLYTCERSFNVEYNELMKERDQLAKELIGMQDVCYNEVFEPDEALKQRARKVKSVEIPETLNCKEKSNVLCQNKSALIGIFRHKKSWLCDAR